MTGMRFLVAYSTNRQNAGSDISDVYTRWVYASNYDAARSQFRRENPQFLVLDYPIAVPHSHCDNPQDDPKLCPHYWTYNESRCLTSNGLKNRCLYCNSVS